MSLRAGQFIITTNLKGSHAPRRLPWLRRDAGRTCAGQFIMATNLKAVTEQGAGSKGSLAMTPFCYVALILRLGLNKATSKQPPLAATRLVSA